MSSKKISPRVWCALVVAQLGFGAYGVIVTIFAKNSKTDPLVFCLLRDTGAFPVMLIVAFFLEGKVSFPSLRSVPLFMVLGATGMFSGQLLYLLGVYLTSANMASMFQPSVPVWSAFVAMLSGVEPPPILTKSHGLAKVLGIAVAITGAVAMTLGKLGSDDNPSDESWLVSGSSVGSQFLGCICLLGQSASTAVYYVIQKKYVFSHAHSAWKNQPMAVTAWSYFFGAIFMALSCLPYVNQPQKFTSFSKELFFCLLYAIFITSSLCYLLLSWCNMHAPSTIVTASWPLQSLFCAILSLLFLHKSLQWLELFGGAFIVSGLAGVLWSNHAEEQEKNMQHNQKSTPAKTSPLKQDWNFKEALLEGYVIVPQGGDE